jgi:pimeloyl-ACP methyl ester carboxylesterase
LKAHKRFESFDGTRISYRVWGDLDATPPEKATPLLFCSGIGCNDVYWEEIAPDVARERAVVTWDYPYHGDSGPPADPRAISIPALARHAYEITLDLGWDRLAIGGHSMGVQVAFEHYREYPERTAAVIAIAGPFRHTVGALYGTNLGVGVLGLLRAAAKAQPDLMTMVWRTALDPKLADTVGRVGGLIGNAPKGVMERYFRHIAGVDLPGLLDMFKKGQEHTVDDILEKIDVPTLVIHGTADVMTPFYLAEELAERVPGARLVRIEGGAHTLPAEDPLRISDEINALLSGSPKKGGRRYR